MTTADDQDRITRLQVRYVLADALLAGMGVIDLREVAAAGDIPVQPGMTESELREAIRASNAAAARAAGVPIDGLPQLTALQGHDLARRLSGAAAPPDEPG
jgi:hypothetical protein